MPRTRRLLVVAVVLVLGALIASRVGQWQAGSGPELTAPTVEGTGGAAPVPRDLVKLPVSIARSEVALATFEGRVVSSRTGEAVAGAELVFSHRGEATSIHARGDGGFRFAAAAGSWALGAASAPGYLPYAPEWGASPVLLVARPGETVQGILVSLTPVVEYGGRVVDVGGRPVAGAEVRLLGTPEAETASMPLPAVFLSGADGRFRFTAPDDAILVARREGFVPDTARVDTAARLQREVVLVLRASAGDADREASLSGQVVDEADAPVPGAVVIAYSDLRLRPRMVARAVSGVDGQFTLDALAPGRYRVVATRPNLAPATLWRVSPGRSGLVLRLARGGAVAGRVVAAATGAPVPAFTVSVRSLERRHDEEREHVAVVDAGGEFHVDGLTPGHVAVAVAARGLSPSAEQEVVVTAGAAPARLTFELPTGGRVSGRVIDAASREPLARALVVVVDYDRLGVGAVPGALRTSTGPDGTFELDGLPGRGVSLRAVADGHHPRIEGGIQVGDGGSVGPVTIALTPLAEGEEPRFERSGLGASFEGRSDSLVVVRMARGGGAAEAGLRHWDEIVRIDGQPVATLGYAGAINMLRGAEGTPVVLGVRRLADAQRNEERVVAYRRPERPPPP